MNKIFFNVTSSYNWNGPIVGIIRTEMEILTSLKKYKNNIIECIWHNNQFIEKEKYLTIKPPKQYMYSNKKNYPKCITRWKKSFIKRYNKIKKYLGKDKNLFYPDTIKIDNTQLFLKGDILISLGLDWDYNYQDYLYELKNKGVHIITCCYDLIPILYPQYCIPNTAQKFPAYLIDIAENSHTILCISECTRKDLTNFLNNTGSRIPNIKVIRLADNIQSKGKVSPALENFENDPFILLVSTLERRKNHLILYHAYHILQEQNKLKNLPKLVFAGMQGWGTEELRKDMELDPLTQGLIFHLNNLTDNDIYYLYKHSLFCVFPSYYEGWGLPVAEALAMGKIVLASQRASIPEIGNNLIEYASPWNAEEWAEKIYHLVTNYTYRKQLETKIIKNYKITTWDDTTKQIIHIIENINS